MPRRTARWVKFLPGKRTLRKGQWPFSSHSAASPCWMEMISRFATARPIRQCSMRSGRICDPGSRSSRWIGTLTTRNSRPRLSNRSFNSFNRQRERMAHTRQQILKRLRKLISAHQPIIGGGAGTGITAKFEEAGGVDLIVIYNSGRYRMAGRGSLAGLMPYGDANAIVMEMAAEVLTVVKETPVLAGVCGTDPFRQIPRFLKEVKEIGFAGIQNFPTVGLYDGLF